MLIELGIIGAAIVIVMGMLTRGRFINALTNRAKSSADNLTERVRDPVADSKAAIDLAQTQLSGMRQLRVEILTQIKGLSRELGDQTAELDKYEQLAKQAGAAKVVEDVKACLEHKVSIQHNIDLLQGEIDKNNKLEGQLSQQIAQRDHEIQDAITNSRYLASSIQFSKFSTEAQKRVALLSGSGSSLEKLRLDANKAQDTAAAYEVEASIVNPGETLEKKYAVSNVSEDDINKYLHPAETKV